MKPQGRFPTQHQMTLARQETPANPRGLEAPLLIWLLSGLQHYAIKEGSAPRSPSTRIVHGSHRAALQTGLCLPASYNRSLLRKILQQSQHLRA